MSTFYNPVRCSCGAWSTHVWKSEDAFKPAYHVCTACSKKDLSDVIHTGAGLDGYSLYEYEKWTYRDIEAARNGQDYGNYHFQKEKKIRNAGC